MSGDETADAMRRLSTAVHEAQQAVTGLVRSLRHHEWDEPPDWLCCRCETCGDVDSVPCQLPPTQEDFLCDSCREARA